MARILTAVDDLLSRQPPMRDLLLMTASGASIGFGLALLVQAFWRFGIVRRESSGDRRV